MQKQKQNLKLMQKREAELEIDAKREAKLEIDSKKKQNRKWMQSPKTNTLLKSNTQISSFKC